MEENSEITKDEALAEFSGKSFINGGLVSNILTVTVISLFVMSVFIMLKAPIWLSMIALLGAMYYLIKRRSGTAKYQVHSWGFSQSLHPNIKGSKVINRSFTWHDVHSFKQVTDMDRQRREYNYLKLEVNKTPKSFLIHDQDGDMAAFLSFRDTFVAQLDLYNSGFSSDHIPQIGEHTGHQVLEKPDFYKTVWAKLITVFFVLFSILAVVYVGSVENVRHTNLYRIFIVVVPGTIYMVWRVFIKKGN